MAEELGKIEKPAVESFSNARKLFFVPLIFCGRDAPAEFVEKYNKYWDAVEWQVSELEIKLGQVDKVLHELVSESGDAAGATIEKLNPRSYRLIKSRLDKGARLTPIESEDTLTEFMDWSRCLAVGLQNQSVFTRVYQFYVEAGKKRNEHLARQVNETLKDSEIGLLLMREGHKVQFAQDIQVFYVAPPELDELNRWLRDNEPKDS